MENEGNACLEIRRPEDEPLGPGARGGQAFYTPQVILGQQKIKRSHLEIGSSHVTAAEFGWMDQ